MSAKSDPDERSELTAAFTVKASPAALWDRLTHFDAYQTWRAPVRIKGDARPGGAVDYGVRARFTGAGDRWTSFPGRITAFDRDVLLRLQVGYRFWLRIELEFVLTAAGGSTNVRHAARLSGVLSTLGGRRLRRIFASAVQGTASALARSFSEQAPPKAPNTPQNRKARRARRATRP